MLRSTLPRGVSAGALALVFSSTWLHAQEALPTIDVGAARTTPSTATLTPRTANSQTVASSAPRESDPTTYNPPNATTALKTNTPIMQTPASVQVVPQQVLRDEQATTLARAVENVSGVIAQDPTQNTGAEIFIIRGFQTPVYYRDGVRMNSQWTLTAPMDMANVDRIEVLKGPASILYGRAEPGGMVNVITKQPEATPYYSVNQQIGSWSFYRTTVDATGPLTKDDTFLYRMNMAFQDSQSFRELSQLRSYFIAPTLRWNIDAATQVNIYLDYKHATTPNDVGLPAFTKNDVWSQIFGNRPLSFLPRERNFSESWARNVNDDLILGANWSHSFNENWTLKHRFQAEVTNNNILIVNPVSFDPVTPTQLDRFIYSAPRAYTHTYFTNLDLTGKFETLGLEHTLLAGGDFQHLGVNEYILFPYGGFPTNIDIFAPIHSALPPPFDPTSRVDLAFRENWYGFYLQDQIKLPYQFFLLAGARYDHANTYDVVNQKTFDNSQRVTPRFGLLWQPVQSVSLYGSYLTNFGGSNISGRRPLPPETAEQWEVGIKTQWFDNRVTATVAYYNLIKQHVATPDPDPVLAAQGYSVATGEIRNKGIELDVAGEILPGWKIIGAYSYINSLVTKDRGVDWNNIDANGNPAVTAGNTGNRLENVPRHSGSVWTTYEIQDGDWRGLKFGGGIISRSIRQGDRTNTYQLPGYATVGLMAGYETRIEGRKVNFQLNVDNLLNTRYYPASQGFALWNIVGAPRTFKGSVRVEF